MSAEARKTTDHAEIRRWIEHRGGKPASVISTQEGDDPELLSVEFPAYGEDNDLEELSWEEFFEKFEASNAAFMYQDKTADGEISRFCKFVRR